MIKLENIHKTYMTRSGPTEVLRGIDLTITPGQKVGILGRNGAGKSTLIRLMSGAEQPTSGQITRGMTLSWPLAFGGAFQGSLTGLDNLKFICRVYNADFHSKIDYVQEFAELGKYFYEPVKTYSSGMRSRLAFAISMAVEFDCFLIDEIISVGDARFHAKCESELFEKRKDRAMIIVSHELHNIREHCDVICLLKDGLITTYQDIERAIEIYNHC